MRVFAISMLSLFSFAVPSIGQQPAAPAKETAPPLTVAPGEMQVAALVELVGRYAQCNILCDPAEIRGAKPIVLTEPIKLDRSSCMETLSSLLYTLGFGLAPVDEQKGIFQVLAISGPRGRDLDAAATVRSVEEVLANPDSKRIVLTTVPLQHVNAPMMTNLLRPMLTTPGPSSTTISLAPAGLVLRGSQHHVAAAVRLIQEHDKPGKMPEREVKLDQRVAELAKQVAELKAQIEELKKAAAGK